MPTTYSSCVACGHELTIEREGQLVHPDCPADKADHTTQAILLLESVFNEDAARRVEILEEAPPRLADSAVWYADQYGWAVFPLIPGGKTPATPNGFKDATTDTGQIRRWWQQNPNYNIGLPTGGLFDVVDVDVPEGTFSWADLRDSGSCPDIHGWVATPSGGWHVYVQPTGIGNKAGWVLGVDFRGAGGYVVAPPSVLSEHDGRRYRFSVYPSPTIKKAK